MIRPSRIPTGEDVARHYDELDRFYRGIWGGHVHHGLWTRGDEDPEEAVEALVDLVATRAMLRPGHHVCDVGCGYGETARILARRRDVTVTGLTLSPVQHRRATAMGEKEPGRMRFLLRDWLENGLPAGELDAVIAIESLSHMEDKPGFFREARRTLRPGGRLVVAAWLSGERPGAVERKILLEPICSEGRLSGLGSRSEYQRWVRGAGFGEVTFEDLTRRVRRTWGICARRLAGRLLRDPETWRYLLDSEASERAFGLSLLRIWLAYRTGALRYGLFTARLPDR